MAKLKIKSSEECRWDEVSLGEVMLRFDPGESRVKEARVFRVWHGGGEFNVARALRKCFKLRTAIVTSIPENDLGLLLEGFILEGGVDTRHVKWVHHDGIGKNTRVGFNFTERGYGIRAAKGTIDRANSSASQLKKGDIDWNQVFKVEGARWFHCGGIFAALSATTPDVAIEAMKAAHENGTIISYDLNYRESLWKEHGGQERAIEVNREIAKYVDVMLGNEEDFKVALGFEIKGVGESFSKLDTDNYKKMIKDVVKEFPNFSVVATTLRNVITATLNDWGAIMYYDGKFYEATTREQLEILDRVGGGDSFASGLAFGFMDGRDPQEIIELGAAHGALAMTTPGDTSMASLSEVEKVAAGGSARVVR